MRSLWSAKWPFREVKIGNTEKFSCKKSNLPHFWVNISEYNKLQLVISGLVETAEIMKIIADLSKICSCALIHYHIADPNVYHIHDNVYVTLFSYTYKVRYWNNYDFELVLLCYIQVISGTFSFLIENTLKHTKTFDVIQKIMHSEDFLDDNAIDFGTGSEFERSDRYTLSSKLPANSTAKWQCNTKPVERTCI